MTEYKLDSVFQFGVHQGLTLQQVAKQDPSYVYWCIRTIESFYISEQTLADVKKQFPKFYMTVAKRNETEAAFKSKQVSWEQELQRRQWVIG